MKNKLFEAAKACDNDALTENGAKACLSTLDKVLDLFFKGSSYRSNPSGLPQLVRDAYNDDKELTLKCLFYLRDIRGNGGQGERTVFRKGIREIAELDADVFTKNNLLPLIPFFGRWDDLFCLLGVSTELDKAVFSLVKSQFEADLKSVESGNQSVSLLAKWLPSCNTSSPKTKELGKIFRKALGYTEKEYRKALSLLRKHIDIIETHITNKDYTFDYSKVPSCASLKYVKCFNKNDGERFHEHIDAVKEALKSGKTGKGVPKDNVKALYPYEIIKGVIKSFVDECGHYFRLDVSDNEERQRLDNLWRQLPNLFGEKSKDKNWLAVVDTSGSMLSNVYKSSVLPIDIAISLGIYISEHNHGIFKDKYITFSNTPKFIEFDGEWPLYKKVQEVLNHSIIDDTNISAVFSLVLDAAVKHHIPVEDMPETIVIISDMQFNEMVSDADSESGHEMIKRKYKESGYPLPKIVYWNASTNVYDNVPITKDEKGTVMIGGCSPGLFDAVMQSATPIEFMELVLNGERYEAVKVS